MTCGGRTSEHSRRCLFTHRFALSAEQRSGEASELGYMLARKGRFAGSSCYRTGAGFTIHRADFDFNFLPVGDDYHSPANDSRAHPTSKRIQAMFDWWERIFDYDRVRANVRLTCERHLWLLFAEAFEKQPADPASLLRHMWRDARHWTKDLHYFQDQFSPIYAVSSTDLEDDRWVVRAWHADQWLSRLWRRFTVKDMALARPDLWASEFPGAPVAGAGAQTGNANLLRFVEDGCFENGQPERYEDIERLNDGLRERGREALISYLCGPQGIVHTSNDLSAILLLDVRARAEGESKPHRRGHQRRADVHPAEPAGARARLGHHRGFRAHVGLALCKHSTSGKPASAASSTRKTMSSGMSSRRHRKSKLSTSWTRSSKRADLDHREAGWGRLVARSSAAHAPWPVPATGARSRRRCKFFRPRGRH